MKASANGSSETITGEGSTLTKKQYADRSLNCRLLKELLEGQKELVNAQKRTNELLMEIRANQRNALPIQNAVRGRGQDRTDSPDPRASNSWRRETLRSSRDRAIPHSPDGRISTSSFPTPPGQAAEWGRPAVSPRHSVSQTGSPRHSLSRF